MKEKDTKEKGTITNIKKQRNINRELIDIKGNKYY